MRHENMKGEFKRSKHEKERERDISEKIALGLHTGAQKPVGDGAFARGEMCFIALPNCNTVLSPDHSNK